MERVVSSSKRYDDRAAACGRKAPRNLEQTNPSQSQRARATRRSLGSEKGSAFGFMASSRRSRLSPHCGFVPRCLLPQLLQQCVGSVDSFEPFLCGGVPVCAKTPCSKSQGETLQGAKLQDAGLQDADRNAAAQERFKRINAAYALLQELWQQTPRHEPAMRRKA